MSRGRITGAILSSAGLPAGGAWVTLTPWTQHIASADGLVLPNPLHVELGPDGLLDVEVHATDGSWRWLVTASTWGADASRLVAVPAGTTVNPLAGELVVDQKRTRLTTRGVSIDTIDLDEDGNLVITLTDGTTSRHPLPAGEPSEPYRSSLPREMKFDTTTGLWLLYRSGDMVTFTTDAYSAVEWPGLYTLALGTLPLGFRPALTVIQYVYTAPIGAPASLAGYVSVDTDGSIYYAPIAGGVARVRFARLLFTYPTTNEPPVVEPGIPRDW